MKVKEIMKKYNMSFNINNNQKIELKQTKDDGSIFVITKDNSKTETTRIISAGDFITMLNWYTYQKSIGNANLEF